MNLRRAQSFSLTALTEAWNLGYAGYFFPVHFSEAQLAQHIQASHLDLGHSLVRVEGRAPVAFSFLGRRGDHGWIGGVGVAPDHRGQRIAHSLFAEQMKLARELGLAQVTLEVLRQNWAKKVYVAAGFVTTRDLIMLTGRLSGKAASPAQAPAAHAAHAATETSFHAHHARLHAGFPACWQRDLPSLQASPGATEVLAVGPAEAPTGMLLLAPQTGGLRIRDGAALTEAAAQQLVAALAARHPGTPLTLVNEPEQSPLHRALRAAGFTEEIAQHEMRWCRQGEPTD